MCLYTAFPFLNVQLWGIGNHGEATALVSSCLFKLSSSHHSSHGNFVLWGQTCQVGKVNSIGGGGQLLPDVWGLGAHGRVFGVLLELWGLVRPNL